MSEAKVLISGPIVGNSSEAGNTYPYTMLEDVIMQLEWQKPFDSVRVTINSEGGRVDKGLGIYDHLRSVGPDVTVTTEAIGQCSSIATIIFLAGSRRLIHEHTECLIHLPRGGCDGATAAEAQQWANDMADCQQKLIDVSAERTGQPADVIAARMAEEKLVTPEDMVSLGFATMVLKPVTALATLPVKAASSASSTHDDTPKWAQNLMSKFSTLLATMGLAVASASAKPATGQAPSATPISALAVTTVSGAILTIETGERTAYEVGDLVFTDTEKTTTAADDTYSLNDGNDVLVAEGAISSITPTAASTTASADQEEAMTQVLSAITNLANEVQSIKQTVASNTAATNKRLNTIAAATGSAGVVEPDTVITASQQGNVATVATGQSAADRRAEKQKQNRKL